MNIQMGQNHGLHIPPQKRMSLSAAVFSSILLTSLKTNFLSSFFSPGAWCFCKYDAGKTDSWRQDQARLFASSNSSSPKKKSHRRFSCGSHDEAALLLRLSYTLFTLLLPARTVAAGARISFF
jgi:hypothetical protein